MNYLKSFFASAALLLLLSPATVLGASYPASCPVEARSIIDAVGGCSTIDSSQYSSIYAKCCSVSAVSNSDATSDTTLEDPSSGATTDTYDTSEPTSESSSEPASDEPTPLVILLSVLFWGGLIYLVVRWIRRRRKKK